MKKTHKDNIDAYLLLLPVIIIFSVFIIYPLAYGFFISLFQWNCFSEMTFVGFDNYISIFKDKYFQSAFLHNVIYAGGTVPGKIIFSLIIAMLLNKNVRGTALYRGIFFLPVVVSFIAVGVLWQRIYDPTLGLLDMFLVKIGIVKEPILWLGDSNTALLSIIIVDIWKWTGYHTVIYIAGLQTIPLVLYESSNIDGANQWQKFRYITLPQLAPITLLNVTIALMGAFSVFDLVYIMTNGGPYRSTEVLLTYMYKVTFGNANSNFGYGSSIAYILFAVIIIITIIQTKKMNSQEG